ncbi:hypothetical protein NEOLEDRAFT_58357 [Neolentinus lepideus HHB14362 ss-1]|uniref:F-box domain-containing protein n=1 Tax=Neolentinus lepideus HHB14362 ss-1 TaxID=1314782 RepID=A0A165U7K6_9AGAM|nr:hypothetical protein NEOLEDRAFT_58357 [Neolentinus lepideus HHB14362 ss-1]
MTDDSRPAYCLPYELLLQVWKDSQNQGLIKNGVWIPQAFVVSQVCRWWRSAALATPDLWREIRFLMTAATPKVIGMVELCLNRSKGCPLDIEGRIGHCDQYSRTGKQVAGQLMAALSKHAGRWETFSLQVDGKRLTDSWPVMMVIDFYITHATTPRLKNLQIYCGGYRISSSSSLESPNDVCRQLQLGRGLPQLSRLHLRSAAINANKAALSNITSLDFGCLPRRLRFLYTDLREILASATNLASLSFTGPCITGRNPRRSSGYMPLHMPSLRELAFSECTSDEDDDWFMFELQISAPNLSSLTLSDLSDVTLDGFFEVFLVAGSSRSLKYPALTRLCLRNVETFDVNQISLTAPVMGRSISQHFDSIKHLELGSKSCSLLSELTALRARSNAELPFPHLRELSLLPFSSCDGQAIQDFLAARLALGIPMEILHLQQSDYARLEPSIVDYFRKHIQVDLVDDTDSVQHSWHKACPTWQKFCTCRNFWIRKNKHTIRDDSGWY